ncbi:protease modulator HflC [Paracoccaceae bacterium GXU_MW_L88]
MNFKPVIPIVLLALIIGIWQAVFIVDERERALVLQFGQVRDVKEEPGLAFKVPFIQNVVRYDDRILSLDTEPLEVTPLDDRRLVVDAFARWRISDVVMFRQAVSNGGIDAAESRLRRILNASLREILGSVDSNAVLSDNRVSLMNDIRDEARGDAESLGVELIDVRIKRADLPQQNLAATFARMQAEREREAADERARGREAAQKVRAAADRTVVELVSEANKKAEIVRGEADAERNSIYADAYGRDEDFFAFYRSLTAYERALGNGSASMVISPDSEFFDYFNALTIDGAEIQDVVITERVETPEVEPDLEVTVEDIRDRAENPDAELGTNADEAPAEDDTDAGAAEAPEAEATTEAAEEADEAPAAETEQTEETQE